MNIQKKLFQILLTFLFFTLIDSVYLLNMKSTFEKQILQIQESKIQLNIYAAILCYIALVFGLWYFIIRENKSILDAALLGWTIYAVYEMTNLAIFRDWQMKTAFVDTLWGGILFAITTWFIYAIYGIRM